ncbi:MAG: thioredoxin [Bacteroidetes bacterium]|jgi:thioredoxin 1|nr:thioredoxin [Bacteroidota bacterium]
MALEFTDANFQQDVLEADKVAMIDFWAEWCGPCRMVGPIVEELAKEYGSQANIGKVNVDHNPEITQRYRIMNIPTILFVKNGQVVDKQVGAAPKAVLEQKLKAHL